MCSVTMISKDVLAYKTGRRHTTALAKVNEGFREQVESECFKEKAMEATKNSAKAENAQATPTASTSRSHLSEMKDIARSASSILAVSDCEPPSKSIKRRQKTKGKILVKLRERVQADRSELDAKISNRGYSICDRDCERCGKSIDYMCEYVLPSLHYCRALKQLQQQKNTRARLTLE